MSLITIIPKQNPSEQQLVSQNEVSLQAPSIVDLKISKDDILSTSYEGTSLIILLKNGEKIVIKDFVKAQAESQNIVILSGNPSDAVQLELDQTGKVTNYLGNISRQELIQSASADVITTTQAAQDDGFSLADFLESNGSKVGLAIATALGVGPLLLDSEKSSSAVTPPDTTKPEVAVATMSADGKKITGTAEANATVILLDAAKNVVATSKVDSSGKFSIDIPNESQTGQVIGVYVEDAAGNVSDAVNITSLDHVAPIITSAQMNDQGNNVIGKTEAESNISLYDEKGNLLGSAKSNVAGEFSIVLTAPLNKGDKAYIVVEDKAKNASEKYFVSPGQDTTPPQNPTALEVSADGGLLKGKVEANAKIALKNAKDVVIAIGQADANGEFTLKIEPALTKDEIAQLYLTDEAGNTSQPTTVNYNTDTLAPNAPTAKLNEAGTEISGKAEVGSTVVVKSFDNKTTLGSAKVDESGNYKITLQKPLTDQVKVNVTAQDTAKNESAAAVVEGTDTDTIAPGVATITEIKDDVGDTKGAVKQNTETDDARPTFTGKGESGAIVTIYDNDNLIGSVRVDAQGNWQFTPTSPLKLGEHSITLYQTDSSNNMSLVSSKYTFTVIEPNAQTDDVRSVSVDDIINQALDDAGIDNQHNSSLSEQESITSQQQANVQLVNNDNHYLEIEQSYNLF